MEYWTLETLGVDFLDRSSSIPSYWARVRLLACAFFDELGRAAPSEGGAEEKGAASWEEDAGEDDEALLEEDAFVSGGAANLDFRLGLSELEDEFSTFFLVIYRLIVKCVVISYG